MKKQEKPKHRKPGTGHAVLKETLIPQTDAPADAAVLRRRAEARLKDKNKTQAGKVAAPPSAEETQRLLQELQIHQIELEMQNEELRQTHAELEASRARYFDLYDLAPAGYCTLSEAGLILEVNLTAATLLGAARAALIRQPLPRFILPGDQDIYYRHHRLLFETGAPQVCELRLVKKDAAPFWVRIDATAAQDADGAPVCRATMIDITERKRADEWIAHLAAMVDLAPSAIMVHDFAGRFLYTNQKNLDLHGYSREELMALNLRDIDVPSSAALIEERMNVIRDGGEASFEVEHYCKDGTTLPLELFVKLVDWRGKPALLSLGKDIHERKRREEEDLILAELGRVVGSTLKIEDLYERMTAEIRKLIPFDSLRVNLFNAKQKTLNIVYVSGQEISNRRMGESYPLRGTIFEEVIRTKRGMIVQSEDAEGLLNKFPSLIVAVQAGIRSIMNLPLIAQNELIGSLVIRSKKPAAYTEKDLHLAERIGMQIAGPIVNAQLFTELQKTETSLRESEGRFRSLFEQAAVGVAEIDIGTSRFITVNRRLCEIVGRTEEEMLATTFHAITHPEDTSMDGENGTLLSSGKITQYSRAKRYLRKDGESVWVNIMISSLGKPGEKSRRNMIVVEDITDRKRKDDQAQLAREVLDLLNRQSGTMDTIHDILQRIKKGMGFEAVGIRLQEGGDFPYYATNGFSEDFVLAEKRLCAYDEDGKILRDQQGNPVLECMCGNIVCERTDASLPFFTEKGSFWTNSTKDLLASTTEEDRQSRTRNRCNGEGYESVALIPLKTGDEVIGLLQLNDRRRNRFTLEMIHFFEGLGASIGIALTRKQKEQQLQGTLESLRKAVGTTIHVLAYTVETRDPYTAGHQTRSSDLARAIATEMKLPQEKIDAIRIAGSIHDIGKLSVPAEILSKPTKLSNIEFSLIKEHSRKGFEMLKDIESPWPLAEIVHQHHERMDGSGYPRNLQGEEILMEARILAIADVVEAMASHRPYRPALGIDAALEEIEKNRGTHYDNAVADACLKLFREKGFQLAVA